MTPGPVILLYGTIRSRDMTSRWAIYLNATFPAFFVATRYTLPRGGYFHIFGDASVRQDRVSS